MTTFVPYSVEQIASVFPGYRVHHLIGAGGMGAVYQATQLSLDRLVAIKVLPPEFVQDPALRALFEGEAKAMARLNHPNLIAVYDFGEIGDIPFIIMEYVHGCCLHDSVNGLAVHPAEATRVILGVCAGLAYAHQHDIVHRDIKPANILLNPQAEPKIGDFGLAKRSGRCASESAPAFGSVHYSAPEVMQVAAEWDARVDIFSVGVVLHELLTGRCPNDDPRPASIIAGCDVRFDAIIRRATMPVPAMRYSSIQEMATDLAAIHSPSNVPGAATAMGRQVQARSERNLQMPVSRNRAASAHPEAGRLSPKTRSSRPSFAIWMILGLVALVAAFAFFRKRHSAAGDLTNNKMDAEAVTTEKTADSKPEIAVDDPSASRPGKSGDPQPEKPDVAVNKGSGSGVREDPGADPLTGQTMNESSGILKPPDKATDPVWVSFLTEIKELDEDIANLRTGAQETEGEFNRKYRLALVKLRNNAKTSGRQDAILAADEAISALDKGQAPTGNSSNAAVKEVENVYLKTWPTVRAQILARTEKWVGGTAPERFGRLDTLVAEISKKYNTTDAKTAKTSLDEAKARAQNLVNALRISESFALIPAGSVAMGDPSAGAGSPLSVRMINVSDFCMAKREVTKAMWDEVRAWGLTHGYEDLAVGSGKAENHPVQMVTWHDVVKWCNARSQKEGMKPCYTFAGNIYKKGAENEIVCDWDANGYRLPTEAEWEKAARGGLVGKRFPWGDEPISHNLANFQNNGGETYQSGSTGMHPRWSGHNDGKLPYTAPVGSFTPNGYGLYDMAGNLVEWCWDWYGDYAAGEQTDPRGATIGTNRVLRGGCWDSKADTCGVAFRGEYFPFHSFSSIGFRVARKLSR
jgi:serine/threonine protein kinase/formylglycine-generating enzyme required for sulfatase activity